MVTIHQLLKTFRNRHHVRESQVIICQTWCMLLVKVTTYMKVILYIKVNLIYTNMESAGNKFQEWQEIFQHLAIDFLQLQLMMIH